METQTIFSTHIMMKLIAATGIIILLIVYYVLFVDSLYPDPVNETLVGNILVFLFLVFLSFPFLKAFQSFFVQKITFSENILILNRSFKSIELKKESIEEYGFMHLIHPVTMRDDLQRVIDRYLVFKLNNGKTIIYPIVYINHRYKLNKTLKEFFQKEPKQYGKLLGEKGMNFVWSFLTL